MGTNQPPPPPGSPYPQQPQPQYPQQPQPYPPQQPQPQPQYPQQPQPYPPQQPQPQPQYPQQPQPQAPDAPTVPQGVPGAQPLPPGVAPPPPGTPPPTGYAAPPSPYGQPPYAPPPVKKSRAGLVIGLVIALIVFAGVGILAALALGSGTTTTTKASPGRSATPTGTSTSSGQAKQPDRGDFIAFYDAPKSAKYQTMETSLKGSKVMENLASSLNGGLALPTDVKIGFAECGTPNAAYIPQKKTLVVCYEMLELTNNLLENDSDSAGQAIVFLFFHELGHAMIDVYQLPVTGREEDAADGVAALLMIEGGSPEIVVAAAKFFYALANARTKINFADEHSLDQQRFYNTLCWVYGSNPSKYAAWTSNGTLPQARAQRCQNEFEQLEKSWNKLLGPYVKQ